MKTTKAMAIAVNGPKTGAQRVQAIKALRQWVKALDSHPELAKWAKSAAAELDAMGDLNLRSKESQL